MVVEVLQTNHITSPARPFEKRRVQRLLSKYEHNQHTVIFMSTSLWIAIGVAIGAVIGVAQDNLAVGVGMGIGVGIALSLAAKK